jgi:hypothetical protein
MVFRISRQPMYTDTAVRILHYKLFLDPIERKKAKYQIVSAHSNA